MGFHGKHTKEAKEKIRLAVIGRKMSEVTKRKLSEARKGDKWCTWKGGKTKDESGYILIHSPNHPFKNNRNYVREHRLVMEKYLGRYLKHSEIIHHINGIKTDNRMKNLKLCKTFREHSNYHKTIDCMANDCDRPHWGNGFCQFHNRQWKIVNNPHCIIKNCKNPQGTARKLCNLHYMRWRNKNNPICIVKNCSNSKIAKGLCNKHYIQYRLKHKSCNDE